MNGYCILNEESLHADKKPVYVRESDGFIAISTLCYLFGKKWSKWYSNKSAKALVSSRMSYFKVPKERLICPVKLPTEPIEIVFVEPAIASACAEWIHSAAACWLDKLYTQYLSQKRSSIEVFSETQAQIPFRCLPAPENITCLTPHDIMDLLLKGLRWHVINFLEPLGVTLRSINARLAEAPYHIDLELQRENYVAAVKLNNPLDKHIDSISHLEVMDNNRSLYQIYEVFYELTKGGTCKIPVLTPRQLDVRQHPPIKSVLKLEAPHYNLLSDKLVTQLLETNRDCNLPQN